MQKTSIMKNLLLISSLLFSTLIIGQDIDSDWMFSLGDTSEYKRIEINNALDTGPGGVNIIWDFSMIDNGLATDYVIHYEESDAYGTNSLSALSSFASFNTLGNQTVSYLNLEDNELLLYGDSTLTGTKTTLLPPAVLFSFPLAFNESVESTCTNSLYDLAGNLIFSNDVEISRTFDGAGRVITPFGTFDNCVRIKEVYQSETVLIETYEWYYEKLSNKIVELVVQPSNNTSLLSWQNNLNEVMTNSSDLLLEEALITDLANNEFLTKHIEGEFSVSVYNSAGSNIESMSVSLQKEGSSLQLSQAYKTSNIYFMFFMNEQTGEFFNYKFMAD